LHVTISPRFIIDTKFLHVYYNSLVENGNLQLISLCQCSNDLSAIFCVVQCSIF
jgi:hypothetical protein